MAGSEVAVRFGENLLRSRRLAGLTQEEAAIRASLHRTEVSMLERGERVPRLDTAIRLAEAVEAKIGDLASGIGWAPGAGAVRVGAFAVEARAATLARGARDELEERSERIDASLRGEEE